MRNSKGGFIIFLQKNIVFLAKQKQITQYKISKDTGIPKSTLSDIINYKKINPGINFVMQIADYFKISIDDLIYKDLESEKL